MVCTDFVQASLLFNAFWQFQVRLQNWPPFPDQASLDSSLPLQASSPLPKPQGPGFSVPLTSPPLLSGPSGHRFNRDYLCCLTHFSWDTFQLENSPSSDSYFISVIRCVGHMTQAEGFSLGWFLTFALIYIHFLFLLIAACLGSHSLSCFLSKTDLWVYLLEPGQQLVITMRLNKGLK